MLPYYALDDDFSKAKATFTVKDQYGDPIGANGVTLTSSYKEKYDFTYAKESADGAKGSSKFTFTFDANEMKYFKGDNKKETPASGNITFTATIDDIKIDKNFTVKVGMPEFAKNAAEAAENIKVEEIAVTATATLEQKLGASVDNDGKDLTHVTGTIDVVNVSNDLKVGYAEEAQLITKADAWKSYFKKGEFKEIDFEAALEAGKTVAVDDVYVVVYDNKGVVMTAASGTGMGVSANATAGKFNVVVTETKDVTSTATSSAFEVEAMKYAETGTYTVEVYTITKVDAEKKEVKWDTVRTPFVVSNNNPKVDGVSQKKVDLSVDEDGNERGALTFEEIVKEAFDFTLAGAELKKDNLKVVYDPSYFRYNDDSNTIFIYKVKFYVPLDNKGDEVYFESNEIAVRKYVEIDGLKK